MKIDKYIQDFVNAGADIITVHQEACTHLHRTIQNIKSMGVKACVSLNPATPVETIKHVIDELDMVLIMTVNPGFGGQSFIEGMTDKIKEVRDLANERNLKIEIQVDGGMKPSNVHKAVKAGADVIVAGSAIFGSGDINKTVQEFRSNSAL